MAGEQIQNYQVNYRINVEAYDGTQEVKDFSKAVASLINANTAFKNAATNVGTIMREIDAAFRPKGRKRDYSYTLNIKTDDTETKLERVKTALKEIKELTTGISLTINAGQKIDTQSVKSQTKKLVDHKLTAAQKKKLQKTASESVETITGVQKKMTKAIGKMNAGLISLEKGRVVNIRTDESKARLEEILNLMLRIKGLSNSALGIQLTPAAGGNAVPTAMGAPYQIRGNIFGNKVWENQQKEMTKAREARIMKAAEQEQEREYRRNVRAKLDAFNNLEKEYARRDKKFEQYEYARVSNMLKKENAEKAQKQRNARQAVNNAQKQTHMQEAAYGNKRRAAVNRLQYSKAPSIRNLPMVSMFNAYMAYGFMKSQLSSAVEYSNIMETARSILRVADSDLGTFERRFDKMSRHVRQIGVDTKFTAVEIAGATRYLAMAGMNIDTINKAMRPITNLALISDSDVAQVADLTTNIMSGYKIKNDSINSVADILASTASRSNVSIVEMAESFKMGGGYLKAAGIDFSESAAAIGILGNSGIKGTMAGTALRAMSTRFAKPTKQAEEALDRLKVKFTHFIDVYGKKVEKVRPLADIFRDLHKAGASLEDMVTIFGKIGGNASMQLIKDYKLLHQLTTQNRGSYGIASEIAQVKQQTTKGLWDQVTSQLTESFMNGYDLVEPSIRTSLREFLDKFKGPELARGLADIGRTLIGILSTLADIGTWFVKNFQWIEPILFTGFVATRLFKLAGALTNVGVAIGFIGKQSAANSVIQLITGLTGLGGTISGKTLSFANKRSIVTALRASGVTGKGAMKQTLLSSGLLRGSSALAARSSAGGLFSSQVATGGGLLGAGASLSAISTGAMAATAGISALVGALGWVAYKTWKIKEAKDAVQEEMKTNQKYFYPSIEALYQSLRKTYKQALDTKKATDDVTKGKTLEEASGQSMGAFTGKWWVALFSSMAAARDPLKQPAYTFDDAYQHNVKSALRTVAQQDGYERIISAFADFGKLSDPVEVGGFIKSVKERFGQDEKSLNKKLWRKDKDGKVIYNEGTKNLTAAEAATTHDYYEYMNNEIVPKIIEYAKGYQEAISTAEGAWMAMAKGGFSFKGLRALGYTRDKKTGQWVQKPLSPNATQEEKETAYGNAQIAHSRVTEFAAALRSKWGGSAEAAENILKMAGFTPALYSNEPEHSDSAWDALRVTTDGADDGNAGGNYSGTGKLSSSAPKQVIVHIGNLLSLESINVLNSEEGRSPEIQNLKEQLAQVLIDTVHDFDASWA